MCGRKPSDPHHLRHVQPRAIGRKSSDEFTVPLCRIHHRALHRAGDEPAWWKESGIDPIKVARTLWKSPRSEGAMVFAIVAAFFAGIILGALSLHQSNPIHIVSNSAMAAISHPYGVATRIPRLNSLSNCPESHGLNRRCEPL